MKLARLLTIGAVLGLVSARSAAHEPGERVLLDATNIAFVYESRAKFPPAMETIAQLVSSDYRNGDQFTRHELLPKIVPVIEEEIEHAEGITDVVIKIQTGFKHFNFEAGGFPTSISDGSAMQLATGYVVVLDNADGAAIIPTEVELAKKISRMKPRPAFFLVKVQGTVGRAVEVSSQYETKNLHVSLTAIEVSLEDGTLVGRKDL